MFRKIGIIGAGQMGAGIAQVCAQFGRNVVLLDVKKIQLEKAREIIQTSANKLFEKSKITVEEKENISSLIHYTEDYAQLKDCNLVIEAVDEREELKKTVLKQIEDLVSDECVIASNTSSIAITKLCSVLRNPQRGIGIHFMNPVPLMKLVEIIPGMHTRKDVLNQVLDFVKTIAKDPISSKDFPGFIVNRILMPMINEAFFTLMEGISTAEEIDLGLKLGANQPMGPLQLADFIGLDTCLAIMTVLHNGLGDTKYRPSPLLVQYVQAGRFGRKSKWGVYRYE
jgi:3-hydroxybutyryl-CoA dehydrogenase